jgi:hypothetical protein
MIPYTQEALRRNEEERLSKLSNTQDQAQMPQARGDLSPGAKLLLAAGPAVALGVAVGLGMSVAHPEISGPANCAILGVTPATFGLLLGVLNTRRTNNHQVE